MIYYCLFITYFVEKISIYNCILHLHIKNLETHDTIYNYILVPITARGLIKIFFGLASYCKNPILSLTIVV